MSATSSRETAYPVNRQTIEKALAMSQEFANDPMRQGMLDQAMRAVKAKDPKILTVMERASDIMHNVYMEQLGEYQKRHDLSATERVAPQEFTGWREAYKTADAGTPEPALGWIYVAGGILAGVVI